MLKILIVDDEQVAVSGLEKVLKKVLGEETEIFPAKNGKQALKIASEEVIDIAFVDIEMPGISGLELAKELKSMRAKINIVIVTAYPEYSLNAWKLHVSDYLLKPADENDVKAALDNLRNPIQNERQKNKKALKVQCFGNFEVFYNGNVVHFSRSKSKELLAYLIDRKGAECTNGEIIGILWEDVPVTSSIQTQLRILVKNLKDTFNELGVPDFIVKSWKTLRVDCDKIDCDYYDFLRGDLYAVNSFEGVYMTQYSWAEMTVGTLMGNLE